MTSGSMLFLYNPLHGTCQFYSDVARCPAENSLQNESKHSGLYFYRTEGGRFAFSCQNGHSLVAIGQAGTGKTVLIKKIDRRLRKNGKTVSITASTGMASRQFQHGRPLHQWAGLSDGRFSNVELSTLLLTDEKRHVLDRNRSTDVLIIDEIRMISRKVFDQLEFVCRTVKDPSLCFGGLQLICVGDFYQIPPQPNDLYGDPGYHAFTSQAWKAILGHKVRLTTVMRQKDPQLVQAVNEHEHGTPSVATTQLKYRLSRPLPDTAHPSPVYLYATNFDVHCHNTMALRRLPGPIQSYQSQDLGDVLKLKKKYKLKKKWPREF
ncbi:uncharacterized protein [Haliotis asinina]|uniref:uncharacterized protein n=1 Tax=Haliotis asinina TaxID=109174 RepID=UPI003531D14E